MLERLRGALQRLQPRRLPSAICPQRAAVAVVLALHEGKVQVVMIRRAEHPQDPWSGHMSFPGGRAAPQDGDPWDTAMREAEEEVGLDLKSAERLGLLPDVQALSGGKALPLAITPAVFYLSERRPLTAGDDEVAEALWIPLDALCDPQRAVCVPRTYFGRSFQLPGVDYEGRIIWGLTYRMLGTLLELLREETGTGTGTTG